MKLKYKIYSEHSCTLSHNTVTTTTDIQKYKTEIPEEVKRFLRQAREAEKRYYKNIGKLNLTEYIEELSESHIQSYLATGSDVEEKGILAYYSKYLPKALMQLSDLQRNLLHDFYYVDMLQAEIARKYNMTQSAVSKHLVNAKIVLLQELLRLG